MPVVKDAYRHLQHAYQLQRACNHALIYATDEHQLLHEMCHVLIDIGGYRMAWVGYPASDPPTRILPIAHAGHEAGYLDTSPILWEKEGSDVGPVGAALNRKEPLIIQDIACACSGGAWHEAALQRGYASAIVLPLIHNDKPLGVLTIYAGEREAFPPQEVELLRDVADDLAYGIVALRIQAEHRQALQNLQRLSQLLEATIRDANIGLIVLNADFSVEIWNHAAERISGYRYDEVVNRSIRELLPKLIPDAKCRDATLDCLRSALAGAELDQQETVLKSKGGGERVVSWNVRRLIDSEGACRGVLLLGQDITERKLAEAEAERAQAQAAEQARLAAVGQLAAGIAHDFNNLLTGVIGYAEIVLASPELPESLQKDVQVIVDQGHNAATLIRQILDFSRQSTNEPRPLELSSFLKEMVKFFRRTLPEAIEFDLTIAPGRHMVRADPAQIQQVIANLVVNACDAMPEGGRLELILDQHRFEDPEPRPIEEMPPGRWVTLVVRDTGVGMSPEVLSRIYEPFFTTKPRGKGTGLGLAQVYGIIQQHEGFILAESQENRGSTFTIYLPLLEEPGELQAGQPVVQIQRGSGETVLFVDDDEVILRVGQNMLDALGYRVLLARDGLEALTVYGEHREKIRAVVADMVMPNMSGLRLARELHKHDPKLGIVIMSGYPVEERAQLLRTENVIGLIQKPLSLQRLGEVVAAAIQEKA